MRSYPLQKYIVFHSYYKDIHLAVVMITPSFPKFPSTLVPFSLIRNHMSSDVFVQENSKNEESAVKNSGSQSDDIKECANNEDIILNNILNTEVVTISRHANGENDAIQGRPQKEIQNSVEESVNQSDSTNKCIYNKIGILKEPPNIGENVDINGKNIGSNQVNGGKQEETYDKIICSTKKKVLFVAGCVGFLSIIIVIPYVIFYVVETGHQPIGNSSKIDDVTDTLFAGIIESLRSSTSQQTTDTQIDGKATIGKESKANGGPTIETYESSSSRKWYFSG